MDKDKKYIASVSMSILDKFKKPFPVKQLKWRKGGGGKELVYISAQQYQNRLDEVMGTNWQSEYNVVTESGLKAFKRACSAWGIGRYLYFIKDEEEIAEEKTKAKQNAKNLPEWATPEGYDKRMEKKYG